MDIWQWFRANQRFSALIVACTMYWHVTYDGVHGFFGTFIQFASYIGGPGL